MNLRYKIWRTGHRIRLLHRDIERLRAMARQIDPWEDPEVFRDIDAELHRALVAWHQSHADLRILHARKDHRKRQTRES